MALTDRKLDASTDFAGYEVSSLDDRPALSASALKARFDANVKSVVVPALNGAIDDLVASTPTVVSVTLASADWSTGSQEKTVAGVTATNIIIVSIDSATATEAEIENAESARIYATAQGTDSVTFTHYGDEPTENIPFNVLILNALA